MAADEVDPLAVEKTCGVPARRTHTATVRETFVGRVVWEGEVQVFALDGHPQAKLAYAWTEPPEQEGGGPRVFVVLGVAPVRDAATAVRASIVQREREKRA